MIMSQTTDTPLEKTLLNFRQLAEKYEMARAVGAVHIEILQWGEGLPDRHIVEDYMALMKERGDVLDWKISERQEPHSIGPDRLEIVMALPLGSIPPRTIGGWRLYAMVGSDSVFEL